MSAGTPVTIFNTHVRVPNGMGSYKNVSLRDFHAEIGRVLAGEAAQETPKIPLRLPNECVAIRYNQHEVELLMYFAEAKRPIRYREDKAKTIPFPATVVHVYLKSNGKGGWTVERAKWLCTDYTEDEVPGLDKWSDFRPGQMGNHLWTLPFPNQYGDGNMCVGRNSYRSLYATSDLRGLNELYHHILIGSPFNDDLWPRSGALKNPPNVRAWLTTLSKEEKFPWHLMVGKPNATTVPVAADADDENYALEEGEEDGED